MKLEATPRHLEFLVEEPSMEAFLQVALPRMIPQEAPATPARVRALDYRIVVLVDRDDEDCHALKADLESAARTAGLLSRSRAEGRPWRIANRIVVEELEAWYFGDWEAVRSAYPRVSTGIPRQAGYRDPDAITGGTWEAFERVMKRYGYFATGLRKIEAARAIAAHVRPDHNRSGSFGAFRSVLAEAAAE